MRTLKILPILALAVVLSSCGEKKLDSSKVEKLVTATVIKDVGVKAKSTDCPDNQSAKKGTKFVCTVVGTDGSKAPLTVTVLNASGGLGVPATQTFVSTGQTEQSVSSALIQQVKAVVKVKCPQIVLLKTNGQFKCTATQGKQKATVDVTQTDGVGTVKYKIAP